MGYLGDEERLGTVRELLSFKDGGVEFASENETLSEVADRMNALGISQMPFATPGAPYLMIHESDLLQSLITGECTPHDPALRAAKPLQGTVSLDDPLSRVQRIFDEDNIAVVVADDSIAGIISKIDVVEFLAART